MTPWSMISTRWLLLTGDSAHQLERLGSDSGWITGNPEVMKLVWDFGTRLSRELKLAACLFQGISQFGTRSLVWEARPLTQGVFERRIKVTTGRLPAMRLRACASWLWKTMLLWPVLSARDW